MFCLSFSGWHVIYRTMADSIMSKAATMEIPINSNGDTGTPEDDSLEQVSGPSSPWGACNFSAWMWHVLLTWQCRLSKVWPAGDHVQACSYRKWPNMPALILYTTQCTPDATEKATVLFQKRIYAKREHTDYIVFSFLLHVTWVFCVIKMKNMISSDTLFIRSGNSSGFTAGDGVWPQPEWNQHRFGRLRRTCRGHNSHQQH